MSPSPATGTWPLLAGRFKQCLRVPCLAFFSNCQSSATGEWSVLTLTPDEFLRRWCQHILPKGLMRMRHYGFLSAAAKARLERLRHLLGVLTPSRLPAPEPLVIKCACCGKPMLSVGRIEALPLWRNLPHRTPPTRRPPPSTP